jgi:hypothetical protein
LLLTMKSSLSQRLKTSAYILCVLAVTVSAGFFIGRGAGNRFVEGILLRESRFPLLLSRPVYQFYDIYTLINSQNPFSRLSGYYSLVDANMIDLEFIKERYAQEQVPVIRRTLLWVLGFSKERTAVLRYYASLYNSSDDDMKKDILAMMQRLDPAFHREFIKKNRATGGARPGK